MLIKKLQKKLENRASKGELRQLTSERYSIDFFSNDYLGMAVDEELWHKIHQRSLELPHHNGSTGSRLISGNTPYYEELEGRLSGQLAVDTALVFNSGYSANLAIFSCLPQKGDLVIYDELSHACIKDGIRLSLAEKMSFKHNDYEDLERKIKRSDAAHVFVAVESVYSMDGDTCDPQALKKLQQMYEINLIVDEAHSTGIFGGGKGFCFQHNLQPLAIIFTLGKAMGIHGAVVGTSKVVRDYLVNFSRPFIYTTAMGPHELVSIGAAFDHLFTNPSKITRLQERIRYFRSLTEGNESFSSNSTPIQKFELPDIKKLTALAQSLNADGVGVKPIFSPTVRQGSERLRICLHAYNTEEEIASLIEKISQYV